MLTSHHITKLIAAERVAQLQAQTARDPRQAGDRHLARLAHRLTRFGSNARQPAVRTSSLAPDTPEG